MVLTGVTTDQKASNIQVGRYAISATTGARVQQPYDVRRYSHW